MGDQLPVYVQVRRPDGASERVRVGSAERVEDGFVLSLGDLFVGASTEPARRAPSAGAMPASGGQGSAGPLPPGALPEVFPPYGRSKGMPIRGASAQDLEFYANGSRRSLGDPSKARFHDKERLMLAAIEGELARQRGDAPSGGGGPDEPPPPGDEDAPF